MAKSTKTKKVINVPEMGMTEISKIIEAISSKDDGDKPITVINKEKFSKVSKDILKPYLKTTIDQKALMEDFKKGELCPELVECFEEKTITDADIIVAYALFDRIVNGYKTKLGENHAGFKGTIKSLEDRINNTKYSDIMTRLVSLGLVDSVDDAPTFEIGNAITVTLSDAESIKYFVKEDDLKADAAKNAELIPSSYRTMVINEAVFNKVFSEAENLESAKLNLTSCSVVSNDYATMKDNFKKGTLEDSLKPYIVETKTNVTKMTRKELK